MRALLLAIMLTAVAAPQKPTDADRAAALVIRWQQVVYPTFENARAFIGEEETDRLNAFLSGGAVRAIRDRLDAGDLKKADAAIARFAAAMIRAGARRSDGSVVLGADAYERALETTCPLYSFCDR